MLKKLLYVIIATASIRLATCDIECYLEKLKNPAYVNSLAGTERLCMNYPSLLQSFREDVKICEVNKISLDGMESFFREFCASDSSIMQNFINTVDCFLPRLGSLTCMPKSIMGAGSTLEGLKKECEVRQQMMSCIVDGVGKPCGAEEFIVGAVKAFESYYEGLCAEAGGAAANTVTVWSVLMCVVLFLMKWQWT